MADTNTPPVTTPNAPAPQPQVNQEMINNLTVKPTIGDAVKVGDKFYSPKDIEGILAERERIQTEAKTAKEEAAKWTDRAKKVYGNPEAPDKEALRDFLMAAGKSRDEAERLIADEFLDPKTETVKKEEPQKDAWAQRAWLQNEFEKASEDAFKSNASLQKFVEAARKREEGDAKLQDEAEEFVRGEIRGNLAIRAERILRQKIAQEGEEAFKLAPTKWFREAMSAAAAEEAGVARRRYGDPNKIGVSQSAPTADPVQQFLKTQEGKGKFGKFDPSATGEKNQNDFADRFARAVLGG